MLTLFNKNVQNRSAQSNIIKRCIMLKWHLYSIDSANAIRTSMSTKFNNFLISYSNKKYTFNRIYRTNNFSTNAIMIKIH